MRQKSGPQESADDGRSWKPVGYEAIHERTRFATESEFN
jgi:hypothetical protein